MSKDQIPNDYPKDYRGIVETLSMMSDKDEIARKAREIARKYIPRCDRCGGGFHYDSCGQCNLAQEIEQLVLAHATK